MKKSTAIRREMRQEEGAELRRKIGARIRELRKSKNMTIKELAEQMGVTAGFLGMIERGHRGFTNYRILLLSKVLDTSVHYLVTGKHV
ncbi:MAG: helix-turn-helix domain-containing protein [Defluviitaleaceae bacterium]|nr:helix-turn-helix domain-containing protein [Defluviitaleaceae bacterium]